jgi:hypothetical protein
MKRILVAVSLAALSVSAFAVEIGAPYEQSQVDRQLPNVSERAERGTQGNAFASDYNFIAPAQ